MYRYCTEFISHTVIYKHTDIFEIIPKQPKMLHTADLTGPTMNMLSYSAAHSVLLYWSECDTLRERGLVADRVYGRINI